jgi:hypothetical protein
VYSQNTTRGYALIQNVAPRFPKVCLPHSPHVGGGGIFMYSTPLTLLFLLRVKELTRMCYGWNIVGNMLTLIKLNNQCGTNPTTSLPLLGHLGLNHNYYMATNGLECYTDRSQHFPLPDTPLLTYHRQTFYDGAEGIRCLRSI